MKKVFIYFLLTSLFTVSKVNAFQISFTQQEVGFLGSSYGAVEFGDFDADGDLDLLVIGQQSGVSRIGLIYINNNGVFNPDASVALPYDFATGDAKWGDYDNDGDLDILISGQSGGRITAILRNDAGSFIEQEYNLQNLQDSAVEWGDIDNDGDLDAVVSGFNNSFDRVLDVYLNVGDDFIKDTTFAGVQAGDIELLDFDKDGDLDLFMTGLLETPSSPQRSSRLLKNENGIFTNTGIQFVPMLESSSDFGDYDGDGDLDLLLSGNGNDGSLEARTLIYRNDSTDFSRQDFAITHLDQSDVKWADFDNDGDLDFIQSGRAISGDYVMEVYENTGSGFTNIEHVFQDSLANSAISVGDYDNDGDVDFAVNGWNIDGDRFTFLFSNNASVANSIPIRPQNSGSLASADGSHVELYWGPGSDNETQASGLTYNIRIGTTEGGAEILSPHLTDDGKYMLSRRGNMESRRSWTAYLQPGVYYWGVQTVDNNFATSIFLSGSFTISVSPTFEEIDPGLPNFAFGDISWADYDNDRDLDLAAVGIVDGNPVSKIFRNDGGVFVDAGITINGSPLSNINWGDYDNDGDLDLLTGNTLYRNDFGNFNFVKEFSPSSSDLTFVDFDNDGDLDIHWVQTGQIFRNDNGTFNVDANASENIIAISAGDAAWGDYDNDGDKDLIIVGSNYEGHLYRNDNGVFVDWGFDFYGTEDGTEFLTNGYKNADIEWADYDNDGDLDFIIIGEGRNQAVDVVRITALYKNNGPDFNNEGQWLFDQTDPVGSRGPNSRMYDAVSNGAVSWGDFDNNGWRDFIFNGSVGTTINPNDYITRIYKNNRNDDFALDPVTNASLRGMGSISASSNSAIAVADYDDDGDLDFIQFGYSGAEGSGGLQDATRLYKNLLNEKAINEAPLPPVNLSYSLHGDTVILSWEPAGDDKTTGSTYNVRIGTNSNSQNIVSANAHPDGKLKMASRGNAQSATTFRLNGIEQNQTYFWSVQAIDASLKSSPFAEESSFNTFPPSVTILYPNGGQVFMVDSTIFIDWVSSHLSDFRLEYSTNNGGNWTEITTVNETFGESSEEWTIPNQVSDQCLVRVVDINNTNISDQSDATFSFVNNTVSSINITSPNGGEQWEASSFSTIFWEHSNVTNIKVEVSYNDGTDYETLSESTAASEGWFGWQLPNFTAPSCFVRLSDVDNPQVMDISDQSFAITDTTGPVFDNTNGTIDFKSPVEVGYMDTVRVKVTDNTELAEVNLYFKTAGTFESFQMGQMTKNIDKYFFPLNATPATGFQLYAEARDIHENITITDTVGIQINIDDKFENSNENVGGSDVQDYVLFSVPVDLADKSPTLFLINNNFDDTPDPEDYRLYSYQNGSVNNFIEYNNSGFGQIIPGKGYFIISNDDFNMVAGNGRTVDPGSTFIIQGLQQGWNLIGSPFVYPVPFANVSAENQASGAKVNFNLWEFNNGSWQKVQTGELLPWRGYALDLEASAVFKIPPYRETLAKTSPTFTTLNNNNDEWMIQIKAQNGRNKSDFNFAGQLFDATNALDNYDLNGPPRIENQLTISFKNDNNENKVTDIRKSNDKGHIWDFMCHLDPDEENLSLYFSGINEFSDDRNYFLIDNQSGISYNLKFKREIDFASKGVKEKSFQLVVGTREYLENLHLDVDLYPSDFSLKQNFPNPFNPLTQISFSIKDAGRVRLAIYNLLGQEVALLVNDLLQPGNYNSVWDASGQSSGIYFIKLSSGQHVDLKRAVFIK